MLTFNDIYIGDNGLSTFKVHYKFLKETDAHLPHLNELATCGKTHAKHTHHSGCWAYEWLSPGAKGFFCVRDEEDEEDEEDDHPDFEAGKVLGEASWFGGCTDVCVIPEGCVVNRCLTINNVEESE